MSWKPKVNERIFHRHADLFGRVVALYEKEGLELALVKYEYPYDPSAAPKEVPASELAQGPDTRTTWVIIDDPDNTPPPTPEQQERVTQWLESIKRKDEA